MANIIDLTQDLRDDEDEPQFPLLDQRRPVSPEVQYVGSRSRTPPQDVAYYLQLSRTLAAAEQRDAARSRSSEHALWRRHRPTVPSQRRPLPLFFGPQAHDDLVGMEMFNSTGPRTLPMPQLDFTMTGFDMHYSTRSNMQRPSMPTYEAPKPARQGFSRSASLGKEFMCPRCQCELGTKPEGAEREVWVISRCGHVYCGSCARARTIHRREYKSARNSRDQVAASTCQFDHCLVQGCDTNAASLKHMTQIYL